MSCALLLVNPIWLLRVHPNGYKLLKQAYLIHNHEAIMIRVFCCLALASILTTFTGCGSKPETAVVGTEDERAAAQAVEIAHEKEMEKQMQSIPQS